MTVSAESDLKSALGALPLPEIDLTLADVGKVTNLTLDGERASITIEMGLPSGALREDLEKAVAAAASAHGVSGPLEVSLADRITARGVQRNLQPLPNVSNVIAVASGKGGVGKSTTAVNLALALSSQGASVGLLDADIYGPSIPLMMGIPDEQPLSEDGESMIPLSAHGLQVMSIGFLIDTDQPMAWRGPMVTQALNQMLMQTRWQELDYLIVDMPPGTGDIQLTLSQRVPVSGAVIVTTPQDIALLDARKGLQMFRKVSIPVLGIVENMSTHICSECGHEDPLFGSGGGQRMAEDYEVELLGQLPLERSIREMTDGGTPTVAADPDSPAAAAYQRAALRMAARLARQGKDYSARFPKIVVEES